MLNMNDEQRRMQEAYDWIMKKISDANFTGSQPHERITFTFGELKEAIAPDLDYHDWVRLMGHRDCQFRKILSNQLNKCNLTVRHGGSIFSTPLNEQRWTIETREVDMAPTPF